MILNVIQVKAQSWLERTFAKIMKEPAPQCLVRLPSGVEKLIDSRCRATIGIVSNPNHGARKLRKAGQSRWLGRDAPLFVVLQ